MNKVDELALMVKGLRFKKQEYSSAERQLSEFANSYSKLDPCRADQLRDRFDAKKRLGLFRVASSLFKSCYPNATQTQKAKLLRIYFAMYSFDNLGFGYDSVLEVIDISKILRGDDPHMIEEAWLPFKKLTTDQSAQNNLENHVFGNTLSAT